MYVIKIALQYSVKYSPHYCMPKHCIWHSVLGRTESSGSQAPKPLVVEYNTTQYDLVGNHAHTQWKADTSLWSTDTISDSGHP